MSLKYPEGIRSSVSKSNIVSLHSSIANSKKRRENRKNLKTKTATQQKPNNSSKFGNSGSVSKTNQKLQSKYFNFRHRAITPPINYSVEDCMSKRSDSIKISADPRYSKDKLTGNQDSPVNRSKPTSIFQKVGTLPEFSISEMQSQSKLRSRVPSSRKLNAGPRRRPSFITKAGFGHNGVKLRSSLFKENREFNRNDNLPSPVFKVNQRKYNIENFEDIWDYNQKELIRVFDEEEKGKGKEGDGELGSVKVELQEEILMESVKSSGVSESGESSSSEGVVERDYLRRRDIELMKMRARHRCSVFVKRTLEVVNERLHEA
jgi:hypothetical protein